MTEGRNHGGVTKRDKKYAPIFFGYRMLSLEIGPERRRFVVHEDLLCSRSLYFKESFQQRRKEIEGECAICTEYLTRSENELTFCSGCGNNFHNECIHKWSRTQDTCPMCRTQWIDDETIVQDTFEELSSFTFEVYIQWLYQQRILIYEDEDTVDLRCYRLILMHLLGETLKDSSFQHVIREEIIECSLADQQSISSGVIELVYEKTEANHMLRGFITELYTLIGDPDSLRENVFPQQFVIDLARAYSRTCRPRPTDKDVRKHLVEAGYIDQDDANPEDSDGASTLLLL